MRTEEQKKEARIKYQAEYRKKKKIELKNRLKMKKIPPKDYELEELMEFLKESNFIEGVRDQDSLDQAKKAWDYLIKHDELTEEVVLTTHKILMAHQCLKKEDVGFYRRCQVWIGGREGMDYTRIALAVKEWLEQVKFSIQNPGEDGKCIKVDHIVYERIHPFVDGNGRTGRLFLNWQRVKAKLPLLIIHSGLEQREYYRWFKD